MLEQTLVKVLAEKLMEPVTTKWAALVAFAPRKDGSLRICADYWNMEAVVICDSYPLLRMYERIDILKETTVFSTLDDNTRYWQIKINELDRDKTALTLPTAFIGL